MEATLSKPKAPTPPSPEATAKAQTGATIDAYNASNAGGMVNQRGPDGSLTYNQVGEYIDPSTGKAIPRYEAVTQLSDTAQQRYDTTNAAQQNMAEIARLLSGQISGTADKPISMDGLPDLASDYSADRTKVEGALYDRLNPQLERARAARETDLANRGIRIGSAAYDRAMAGVGQNENDARMGVIREGGAEQSRLAALGSATRAQGLQERTSAANEPINRLAALLSGSQVSMPNYQTYTPGQIAPTDVSSIMQNDYGNRMSAYNTQMNSSNSQMGALFGLGSAALMGNPFGMFGAAAGLPRSN